MDDLWFTCLCKAKIILTFWIRAHDKDGRVVICKEDLFEYLLRLRRNLYFISQNSSQYDGGHESNKASLPDVLMSLGRQPEWLRYVICLCCAIELRERAEIDRVGWMRGRPRPAAEREAET